ncbi:MAG: vWA domain-containing protein [Treponemataceae bacterium]
MALDLSKYTVTAARPLPVLLLLDGSSSMSGKKIKSLNGAVNEMIESFKSLSAKEIDITVGIITFGDSVDYVQKLKSVKDISNIHLVASGLTPMGSALTMAKDLIEDRDSLPSSGYRPAVVLVSDGQPTDEWEKPLQNFIAGGRSAKCDRFSIAIGSDADRTVLSQFVSGTENKVYEASDADKIKDCFRQVTMSVSVRSKSQNPNKLIALPDAAAKIASSDDFMTEIERLLGE